MHSHPTQTDTRALNFPPSPHHSCVDYSPRPTSLCVDCAGCVLKVCALQTFHLFFPNEPELTMNVVSKRVPFTQKFLLGMGESVLMSYSLVSGFFGNTYFLEVACLNPSTVAAIQLTQGFFDLLNDPLIGALSDATKTSYGRRRPWMLVAACLLPLSFYGMFSPSGFGENSIAKTIYYMICYCGVSVGVTCMSIAIAR